MERISDAIGLFFAATMIAAVGFEINRRRQKLREVYDVLDHETRHIAIQLEQMVDSEILKPNKQDFMP